MSKPKTTKHGFTDGNSLGKKLSALIYTNEPTPKPKDAEEQATERQETEDEYFERAIIEGLKSTDK